MTKQFIAETIESAQAHAGNHDIACDAPNLILIANWALSHYEVYNLVEKLDRIDANVDLLRMEISPLTRTDAVGRYQV